MSQTDQLICTKIPLNTSKEPKSNKNCIYHHHHHHHHSPSIIIIIIIIIINHQSSSSSLSSSSSAAAAACCPKSQKLNGIHSEFNYFLRTTFVCYALSHQLSITFCSIWSTSMYGPPLFMFCFWPSSMHGPLLRILGMHDPL